VQVKVLVMGSVQGLRVVCMRVLGVPVSVARTYRFGQDRLQLGGAALQAFVVIPEFGALVISSERT
jgi:hypothetical protein